MKTSMKCNQKKKTSVKSTFEITTVPKNWE
jgi:hypothetical protein